MTSYADTGWLCSLYAPDANTGRAAARMLRQILPLPFTWLHQLEFRNALRLRVFRKEITIAQRDASINAMLADLAAGVFAAVAPPIGDVMMRAEAGLTCIPGIADVRPQLGYSSCSKGRVVLGLGDCLLSTTARLLWPGRSR